MHGNIVNLSLFQKTSVEYNEHFLNKSFVCISPTSCSWIQLCTFTLCR